MLGVKICNIETQSRFDQALLDRSQLSRNAEAGCFWEEREGDR
jgi:hypothetical protein